MTMHLDRRHPRLQAQAGAQRGIGLIEALLAFLVLSLGMLAIARLQSDLRSHAELARQRSEAVRVAQQEIETLRAYSVLTASAGARSYDQIVTSTSTIDSVASTRYELARQVDPSSDGRAASLTVTVRWNDKHGEPQHTALSSVIARSAPALAAALLTPPSGTPVLGAFDRSPRIPLTAKDLGDGRSAFKPAGADSAVGSMAFVQDNRSGQVVARCSGLAATLTTAALTPADLTNCDTTIGLLLSGTVRFAQGLPMPFEVALALSEGTYPQAPQCTTSATLYHCVVYPSASGANAGRWSGRTTLVPIGWRIGAAAEDRRVCRFSSDLDASGAIDRNVEHPAAYAGVDSALAQQNFLVIAGTDSCPGASPTRVAGDAEDIYADLATLPHQP